MLAYLGFGSNSGKRFENIVSSLEMLDNTSGCKVLKISGIYETEPYGVTDQPNFLNLVCEIETSLEPKILLEKVKLIENAVGRRATFRWGPREIDIDILLYGDVIIDETDSDGSFGLTIPHKDMSNRDFVIIPLIEISPDIVLPSTYEPLKKVAERQGFKSTLKPYHKKIVYKGT